MEMVDRLVRRIAERGVPLCEVRPRQQNYPSGDVDFLVPPAAFARLTTLLHEICLEEKLSFVTRHLSAINVKLYVLLEVPQTILIFDFWKELQVRDPRDARPCWQGLRWENLANSMTEGDGPVLQLRPETGYRVYLTHLYTMKKSIKAEAVQERLAYYRHHLPDKIAEAPTNESLAENTIQALDALAAQDIYRQRNAWIAYVRDGLRARLPRWSHFFPAFGVVVGVDGAGKTSLLANVAKASVRPVRKIHFRMLYKNTFLYKLLSAPHAKLGIGKSLNAYDEKILLPLVLIAFCRFRRVLRADPGSLPMLDRYFYDFFLVNMANPNPARAPSRAWWSYLLAPLLPVPPFSVWVWADFEQCSQRKNELSRPQWEAYTRHIRARVVNRKHKTICVIHNNGGVEEGARIFTHCLESYFD